MFKFIENIGDYFSGNYFTSDFKKNVIEKSGYSDDDLKSFESAVRGLKEKYFAFKKDYIDLIRCKDQIQRTNKFHNEVLKILGYDSINNDYNDLFHLDDKQVIPVRQKLYRGDKPHLFILEMKALIKTGEQEPKGLFEQNWNRAQWESVFEVQDGDTLTPSIINEAINELFLIDQHIRPTYILLLAGNEMYLLHFEKWFKGSYLRFKLEDLFDEATLHKDYYQLFYLLLSKSKLAPEADILLMDQLDEDSHKSAYAVTKDLKAGIIHAVELLANEALYYKKKILGEEFEESEDAFEQQMKDDCLTMVYRLLFVFYAESRPDLGILPMNDQVYEKGYSLDMLRELEQVQLNSESSRIGYFFHESLQSLFQLLNHGYRFKEVNNKSFTINRLDTPLFDDEKFHHLKGIKFRNGIWQDIICQLSLSQKQKGKARGRISYANLGINQLGSVYEGLLAYRGFYAEQDYIEVHEAGKPNEGTFVVPRSRLDDFNDNEVLKDDEGKVKILTKGTFVYRLSGRDRQQSASYYTPEVLTRTTVKYTLKPILERLDKKEIKADDLLDLKILEPAQGASAFQNEVVNQIADAYLDAKQIELKKKVPAKDYQDQLQRVKAFIATNNVYGVDINPTAIELGKLSLWLNVIHKDMEVPYFGYRLGVGNAVVGTWLKVYKKDDFIFKPRNKNDNIGEKKEWWEKAPEMRAFNKGKLARKEDEIYHFLLPDKNMVPSAGIKLLKKDYENEAKSVSTWKSEFIKPIRGDEFIFLLNICKKIDELLEEHYSFQNLINQYTGEKKNFFGHEQLQGAMFAAYEEKDQLAQQRNKHNAPYFKLKMVMDYWCALWFWDVRQAIELPSRKQWYEDIQNILELDLDTVLTEGEDLFSPVAEQQTIFEEPKQLRLKAYRSAKEKDLSLDSIKKYTNRADLFENKRLDIIKELAIKYKYFHNQLEFIEVFKQKGGFDVIVGNPPWVKIAFDKSLFFLDYEPHIALRGMSSSDVESNFTSYLNKHHTLKNKLFEEETAFESSKSFFNSINNYQFNKGGKSNLFRLVLENSLQITRNNIGLVIDEGLFDDTNIGQFRKHIFHRLIYLFRFNNELKLFSEVGNAKKYELLVLGVEKAEINFDTISNLFHPITIDSCYAIDNKEIYSIRNEKDNWELKGNRKRIIRYDSNSLNYLKPILEPENSDSQTIKLPLIHNNELFNTIVKTGMHNDRLKQVENVYSTQMINETNGQNDGTIERFGDFLEAEQFVFSGPHYYIANPFNKNPNQNCSSHRDYSKIDLNNIGKDYLPRTVYKLNNNNQEFIPKNYYHIHRRRAMNTNERTLIGCIAPPNIPHTNSSLSIHFKNLLDMMSFSFYSNSIIYDYLIRVTGNSDMWFSTVENLPFFVNPNPYILHRGLRLNALNDMYSELWNNYYHLLPVDDCFSRQFEIDKLKQISPWKIDTPLRTDLERRQALIEIDVLVAFELELSLEELISIYEIQFPVMKKYDLGSKYNKMGNLVDDNEDGYKVNRVEDYKRAWAHFEEMFKEK